ncbi:TonB family protein [Pelagicoccus sp. SDUM812003]|uniref:TonB family protein n=1 Tax=Pelagicoccus sp. SDUM812003 TaxID=3041267 RepID=UPI00281076A7|nr:TonB family protein [Pelagicoccus sp. SDUM812003]MDQ8205443.1 TonB family protein [Pelagicoccus sp. SDUM812003]
MKRITQLLLAIFAFGALSRADELETYLHNGIEYTIREMNEEFMPIKKAFPKVSNKREGRVLMGLVVDENGAVSEVFILETDAHKSLQKASVKAAKQFVFHSSDITGYTAPYIVRFHFKFQK